MLNVTVAGSSAIQQSNNSITAGLISNAPNEMKSIEQAMASTSFFNPKVQGNNHQQYSKFWTKKGNSIDHQITLVTRAKNSQQNKKAVRNLP